MGRKAHDIGVGAIASDYVNEIFIDYKKYALKPILEMLQLTKDPLWLNKIFLAVVIIITLVGCFVMKYYQSVDEVILSMVGLLILVIFKIIGYILLFDFLYYYLDDTIDKNMIYNNFEFFAFYNPWIMVIEIVTIGFIVDSLIFTKLLKNIEKAKSKRKINLNLNFNKTVETSKNKSKELGTSLQCDIKRPKTKFCNPYLIYILTILRFLFNLAFGYLFANPIKSPVNFTNKLAAIFIYLDLIIFILIPLFLYISILIYIENKHFRFIFTGISSIFKGIYKAIGRSFNNVRRIINWCLGKKNRNYYSI